MSVALPAFSDYKVEWLLTRRPEVGGAQPFATAPGRSLCDRTHPLSLDGVVENACGGRSQGFVPAVFLFSGWSKPAPLMDCGP